MDVWERNPKDKRIQIITKLQRFPLQLVEKIGLGWNYFVERWILTLFLKGFLNNSFLCSILNDPFVNLYHPSFKFESSSLIKSLEIRLWLRHPSLSSICPSGLHSLNLVKYFGFRVLKYEWQFGMNCTEMKILTWYSQ